jgi:hypothetical protein
MATKSHYYADKIIAEHPRAIYVFGDDFVNSSNSPLLYFLNSYLSTSGKVLNCYNTTGDYGYIKSSVSISKVAPIVYGSDYSIYVSGNSQTITIPSFGIFTYDGKYNSSTLEFWTKIEKPYLGKRKIVGTLKDVDDGNGLYVNQTSLIFQIGSQKATAYIKDFDRPFLIQILSYNNNRSLIVNGELLASLSLSDDDLDTLSDVEYITFGKGTYDCISIYPYKIDRTQALRRFAFGQGVSFQENTVSSFDGKSIIIDYSKSKYANNYNYTSSSNWKQSKNNNLDVKQYSLSNFQYTKPTFLSDTKTISDLESTITGTTFNLKSSPTLSSAKSNLKIDTLEMMSSATKAFYMHGYYTQAQGRPTSEEILFKVVNKNTKDYFMITVNGHNIYYKLKYNSATEYTVLTSATPTTNLILNSGKYNFIIGIDIDKFAQYCIVNNQQGKGSDIKNFFTNPKDLIVYVGGNDDLSIDDTVTAEIYSVKFLTQENLEQRSSITTLSEGVFDYPSAINSSPTGIEATQNNIIGSYDIRPYKDTLEYTDIGYRLTVATNGYWKNDIPLTHFCKTVKDVNGNDTYTFDFIQFNLDYESPIILDSTFLDTTNYQTSIKSYVTFEPLTGAYQPDSVFTIEKAKSGRVIYPSNWTNPLDQSWKTTKYEITDNFVIYPPKGIDLAEYTMVVHLDFSVLDTENNLINVQKMQFASQAYNANKENSIGTKFGSNIIPYTYTIPVSTKVYDYKAYNPYVINKKENPYIYVARDSGIRLVGFNNTTAGVYRGIKIPINESLNSFFNINVIQLSVFYNAELDASSSPFYAKFPNASEQIFEIQASNKNVKFYLTRTGNGDTATISAISNGVTNEDTKYYLNGELSASPSIYTNKWYTLSIIFSNPLIFDGAQGEFDLVGGISIDNLSYYQFTPQQMTGGGWQLIGSYNWQYVANTYTWEQLPNLSSILVKDFYSMFTGTNRLTGISNTSLNLSLLEKSYEYYSNLTSEIITTYAS